MEKNRLKKLGSSAILLATAIIWGFAFVAQTVGADYIGAFTFNGIRFLLGALSLIPVIHFFEKTDMTLELKKKTLICGSIAGVFLFSASTLQQFGIQLTGNAGKASFITGFYTVLVPVAAFFLLHKKSFYVGGCCFCRSRTVLCVHERRGILRLRRCSDTYSNLLLDGAYSFYRLFDRVDPAYPLFDGAVLRVRLP